MNTISLPKKIKFEKGENSNNKLVTIEPCYPGYGITLGNAIRRVALSSLPGAAVTGVKIKGANHEFMTLPHIKEDVLEIILNLKQLRLKIHGDEDQAILELNSHGEKIVQAGDIKKNSQIEIVNKNLVLANITDMAGNLSMEIFVSRGKGYETIDSRNKEKHIIGHIEIDSIFSPVLAVSVNVDNVRVGKMTNWDRLVLNITTNGIITPEEAFEQSIKILIKQFNALIDNKKEKKEVKEEKEIKEKKKIKKKSGVKNNNPKKKTAKK